MAVSEKPVAVLCTDVASGFQYMLSMLGDNVAEYSSRNRQRGELFDTSGQKYIMVCNSNQLKGIEISDYKIAPGFGHRKGAMEIVEETITRIR